jgi:hypothetical protein
MFINECDIEEYNLEVDDKGQVQMEQFPDTVAIARTKEYINNFIDADAWNKVLAQEEIDREKLTLLGA